MRMPMLALVALSALIVLVPGCGENSTGPESFMFQINVVDAAGNPVPDLNLILYNDSPLLQDVKAGQRGKFTPDKAAVRINYSVPTTARARLKVLDIEGRPVRALVDSLQTAGTYSVFWDGRDDAGNHQLTGRYRMHLTEHDDTGAQLGADSMDVWMALADLAFPIATTDDAGRIHLADRRLFPQLYELDPMEGRDENGNDIGLIELGPAMVLRLADASGRRGQRYSIEVTGPGAVTLTWDPPVFLPGSVAAAPASPRLAPVRSNTTGSPLPTPPSPELGVEVVAFPNPFN